jgi:hypothetical protein
MSKSPNPFALTLSIVGENQGDTQGSLLALVLTLGSAAWAASDEWPAYSNPAQAVVDYVRTFDPPSGPTFASQFVARKLNSAIHKLNAGK